MPDLLPRFIEACQAANPVAATGGFPPFTAAFRSETPLNSGPYIYDMPAFEATFGTSPRRRRIIADCRAALDRLEAAGVRWQMLLVGGSFIREGDAPSDLDGLLLYAIDPSGPVADPARLSACMDAARTPLVDLKYCPADVHPIVLVKRVVFFSSLYGYDRATGALLHGTVMLVPGDLAGPRDNGRGD